MATYQFKLPDIGEGIAEAEVVKWHVKVGDRVEEDQQLADMMTDKATVEMESPVAGTVTKLAGEVGDLIAIGSVLVEIETDAAISAEEAPELAATQMEQPLGDGAVVATEAMKDEIPTSATETTSTPAPAPFVPSDVEGRGAKTEERVSTSLDTNGSGVETKVLASPAACGRGRGWACLEGRGRGRDSPTPQPPPASGPGSQNPRLPRRAPAGARPRRRPWRGENQR